MNKIIKARIIELDYTNKKLADMVGVSEQTISNWISERNTYYLYKFVKLLCILEIDPCKIKKDL